MEVTYGGTKYRIDRTTKPVQREGWVAEQKIHVEQISDTGNSPCLKYKF